MTTISTKTIWGDYIPFNDAPIHSVIIWGNGIKFLKIGNALPRIPLHKQNPNCFNLNRGTYCVLGTKSKVKVVKQSEDLIMWGD